METSTRGNEEVDIAAKNTIKQANRQLELDFGLLVCNNPGNKGNVAELMGRLKAKTRYFIIFKRGIGEEINLGFGCSTDVVVISRIRLGHCCHRSVLPLPGNLPDAQGEFREQETVPRYFKMQEILSPKEETCLETTELLEKLFITFSPCWIRRTGQTWRSCDSIRITQQNLIRNYKEQKETVGGSNTQWMPVVYRNQRRSDTMRVTCWRCNDRAE